VTYEKGEKKIPTRADLNCKPPTKKNQLTIITSPKCSLAIAFQFCNRWNVTLCTRTILFAISISLHGQYSQQRSHTHSPTFLVHVHGPLKCSELHSEREKSMITESRCHHHSILHIKNVHILTTSPQ
jgi:hypothetical protein